MFHDILQSQIGLGYYGDVATYGIVAVVTVLFGMFYLNPSRTFYPLTYYFTRNDQKRDLGRKVVDR